MEKKINTHRNDDWGPLEVEQSKVGLTTSHPVSLCCFIYQVMQKTNNDNHSPVKVQQNQYLNKLTNKTNSLSEGSVLIGNNLKEMETISILMLIWNPSFSTTTNQKLF